MKYLQVSSLILFLATASFADDNYSFKQYDLNKNLTMEGDIQFSDVNENGIQKIKVDAHGAMQSYIFSAKHKQKVGFNIWDIRDNNQVSGISIFAMNLDKTNLKLGFETKDVELLDRNHTSFRSPSWVFKSTVKSLDEIKLNEKVYEAFFIHTFGERPTGPTTTGGCYQNQTGVIEIKSWYEKESGKLLKQIFDKRHCTPDSHRLLTKEILEFQEKN
jgi:hypothetical protein